MGPRNDQTQVLTRLAYQRFLSLARNILQEYFVAAHVDTPTARGGGLEPWSIRVNGMEQRLGALLHVFERLRGDRVHVLERGLGNFGRELEQLL
jgi:hypothetical protein